MQKPAPLFLNVDLSQNTEYPKVRAVVYQTKSITPQKKSQSPISQASRKTSQLLSRMDLLSKRSHISTESQNVYLKTLERANTKPIRSPSPILTPTKIQNKQRVNIYVRIKPNFNEKSIVKKQNNTYLTVNTFEDSQRQFEFAHIFDDASQEEVYNKAAKPTIKDSVEGRCNGVILVYGQTGSGKTHTMGLLEQSQGLTQLALKDIFNMLDQQVSQKEISNYTLSVSFVQIYMDKIYDLLSTSGNQLQIREQKDSYPYIQGAIQMQIQDAEEGFHLVGLGIKNRIVAAQVLNLNSSRSHTLLIVQIKRTLTNKLQELTKLAFIDLAGSERNKKTHSTGIRLDEATSINESLSALGNVIVALGQPNQQHIPYRESKLTRILQGYLQGDAQITLICTITKTQDSLSETLSTLQFAQRCKDVILRPIKHFVIQDEETVDNNDLQKQIQELKQTISDLQEQLQNQKSKFDKDYNKFVVNIIIKLKQFTSQNIQKIQSQQVQSIADKVLLNFQQNLQYSVEHFPQDIQQLIKNQQSFYEVQEMDEKRIEKCLEGDKESIKDLARMFTQDINNLVQSFKLYYEGKTLSLLDQIKQQYRQKELNAWASGVSFLLNTIALQHQQLIELIRKTKPIQSGIATDYYILEIKKEFFNIVFDKGQMYKNEQGFKDLINQKLNQPRENFKRSLSEVEQKLFPEKYSQKIDKLLKSYGQLSRKLNKSQDPPPIFHSATVNVSNLMHSRKYQQNPFHDISSLENHTEQINSNDESNPIVQIADEYRQTQDSQQGKLRFKEDDFFDRNSTAQFKMQEQKKLTK
ncbi:hypothetical protein pb186bvf_004884 [Paramecium bursaria]